MGPSMHDDWVTLRDFDDPVLAGDVITAILSMDFDAVLVNLANNSIVAGMIGSDSAPEESVSRPFELKSNLGGYDPVLGLVHPAEGSATDDEKDDLRWDAETGGPWRLMVPADMHDELDPILHVIIEEQKKFDSDHDDLQRTQLRISRYILLVVLLFILILALRSFGVL